MPSLLDLLAYGVEVNWRLMWFPIRKDAPLEQVKVRADTIRLFPDQIPAVGATQEVYDLGQQKGDSDALDSGSRVVAFLTLGSTTNGLLEANLQLQLGAAGRQARVRVEPGVRVPFMLALHGGARDRDFAGTAAVVDGVMTGGGARLTLVRFAAELFRR